MESRVTCNLLLKPLKDKETFRYTWYTLSNEINRIRTGICAHAAANWLLSQRNVGVETPTALILSQRQSDHKEDQISSLLTIHQFLSSILSSVDINECATDRHNCIPRAQRCDNTVGSFLCVRIASCGTGYTLQHTTGQCEGNALASSGLYQE